MQNQLKSTPGPWKVAIWDFPNATPPRKELNIESAANLLATVQCDLLQDNPYVTPVAEAMANARLIASAPELLAHLKDAIQYIDADCKQRNIPFCFNGARVAIAQAEGRD